LHHPIAIDNNVDIPKYLNNWRNSVRASEETMLP
jgi:hypothetical protein